MTEFGPNYQQSHCWRTSKLLS